MNSESLLIIGAVISLLCTEFLSISPGGVIVPGMLALYIDSPARLGITLAEAALAYSAVRLLSRSLILFGRRRHASFLLAGFLARFVFESLIPGLFSGIPLLAAAGWLIPGLIAADADRQGPIVTLFATAAATSLTALLWILLR